MRNTVINVSDILINFRESTILVLLYLTADRTMMTVGWGGGHHHSTGADNKWGNTPVDKPGCTKNEDFDRGIIQKLLKIRVV